MRVLGVQSFRRKLVKPRLFVEWKYWSWVWLTTRCRYSLRGQLSSFIAFPTCNATHVGFCQRKNEGFYWHLSLDGNLCFYIKKTYKLIPTNHIQSICFKLCLKKKQAKSVTNLKMSKQIFFRDFKVLPYLYRYLFNNRCYSSEIL